MAAHSARSVRSHAVASPRSFDEAIAPPEPARSREPVWVLLVRSVCCWVLVGAALFGATFVWAYWAVGLDSSYVSRQVEKSQGRTFTTGHADKVAPITPMTPGAIPPVEVSAANEDQLLGYIRIPSFSKDFRLAVQEGTDKTVLDMMGAGHLKGTAFAGQRGNMFLAGHATYTDFANIKDLAPGDQVIIEGENHWWVYEIDAAPRIVDEHDTAVTLPSAVKDAYGITLQTCWPILSTTHVTDRMIVTGRLAGWADKSAGVPEQLAQDTRSTGVKVSRALKTVSEKVDLPLSGVIGLSLIAIWGLVNAVCWMVSWRRMTSREWRRGPVCDPIGWTWRLTAGIWPSNDIVFAITRGLLYTTLVAGLVFCAFRWACPWIADTFLPGQIAHPGM